jgi:hypothetical protein
MKLQGHMIIGDKAIFIEDGVPYYNIETADHSMALFDNSTGSYPTQPLNSETELFVFVCMSRDKDKDFGFWTREAHLRDLDKSKIDRDFVKHYKELYKELKRISEFAESLKEQLNLADNEARLRESRTGRYPLWSKFNESGRLHCETGPAVQWLEGPGEYYWHGTSVPSRWIEDRANLAAEEVIRQSNTERRAAGCQIVGWPKMLEVLQVKVLNDSGNEDIGQLIEITFPGENIKGLFLKAKCPRNGVIVEGVPSVSDIDKKPIKTALAAQAWRIGDPQSEYEHPPVRT